MTPIEALDILAHATGLLQLTRADHQRVSQAVATLAEAIAPIAPKPNDTDNPQP